MMDVTEADKIVSLPVMLNCHTALNFARNMS